MSENIKKLCKYDGKWYYQQEYKTIIKAAMLSNPEGINGNIPMSPGPYMTFKKTSSRKTLNQFSEVLDVKQKTSVRRLGADK